MTTVNQIDKWLNDLRNIYLVNEDFELNVASRENQIKGDVWRPVGYIFENNGLYRGLNAYKKKLVGLERRIIRMFRFPNNIIKIFNNTKKKEIYLEGQMDMRIAYKRGEWRLHDFGFGWMSDNMVENYISRDNYDVHIQYSLGGGWRYLAAVNSLENSDDFLKMSLLFLKDILTKPPGRSWQMDG